MHVSHERYRAALRSKKTTKIVLHCKATYKVGYTLLKSANVSVVSRRARRVEHGFIRLALEFRRGPRHLSKM